MPVGGRDERGFDVTKWQRDFYPSIEVYQDVSDAGGRYTREIKRQHEPSILALLPFTPSAPDMELEPAPFDGGTYSPGVLV